MAANYGNCSGCLSMLTNKEFLECTACENKYDIDCAKISSQRFYSFYSSNLEQKRTWKCPECNSKQPKMGNLNTPIHSSVRCETKASNAVMPSPHTRVDDETTPSDHDNKIHSPGTSNVTIRSKRQQRSRASQQTRQPHTPPDSPRRDDYLTEDRLRVILSDTLHTTIRNLVSGQLKSLNDQVNDLKDSMTFYNQKYEDMKASLEEKTAIINGLKSDNTKLKSTVLDLSNRLNMVEQNMRECNIEVNGIPEHKTENLVKTIEQLANVIDAPIVPEDILYVTRVAKLNRESDRPRTVVAKLRTPRQRDEVLAAVTAFNKKNPNDKLSSQHLGFGDVRKPVYVSEHLSPANKSLHAAARLKARELGYKFTWIRNGRIFVRKDEFGEFLLIRNSENLKLIK